MGSVIPLRRLGMVATCPSPARHQAYWLNAQQVVMINAVGAWWVGAAVLGALLWAPWGMRSTTKDDHGSPL